MRELEFYHWLSHCSDNELNFTYIFPAADGTERLSRVTGLGIGLAQRITFTMYERAINMASKKARNDERKKADWVGFLNVDMTPTDWELFDNQQVSAGKLFDALDSLVVAGFKFTFTPMPDNASVNVMMYQQFADMPCPGHAISAFAPTTTEALRIVMFKHYEILGGKWDVKRIQQKNNRG